MYRNGSIDTHICIQKAYFWILWPLSLYPLLISCHICFTQVTISCTQICMFNISEYSQETSRGPLKRNHFMICLCIVQNSQWMCVVLQCPDLQGSTPLFLLLPCFFKAFTIYSHVAFLCCLNKNNSIWWVSDVE